MDEKIFPVEEMIAYEEFTGRVEILRELDNWVKNIQRMAAPSTAIMAPRRMGKTVLLDRLVNTVFFKPEYKVAPFYFTMKRDVVTLHHFLLEYATTFFKQYIAYCHQDVMLYRKKRVGLESLLDYPSDHKAVNLAKEFIEDFLKRYYKRGADDARHHWENFISAPEDLASFTGIRVAVIIDEFQDMKFYVHHVDEKSIEDFRIKHEKNPDLVGVNLPASYHRMAQSKKAPMLVSGSSVTMIFKTVMGGPLGGRFGFKYLKPLSVPDGAALLHRLLKLYTNDASVSPENALHASNEVGGHPYYLYCLSVSDYKDKSFDSKKAIDRVIRYEIENGKIYGFWQTHFEGNRRHINDDNDEELGKKIIYYFTKYNNKPVDVEEIANKLKVPEKTVQKKIERLRLADLVYLTANKHYTFNDISLMRFIQFVYEKDWKDVDKISLSQQNKFNRLKGRFLEMVVELTMRKFNHDRVDGAFFGQSGEVELPLFQTAGEKYVKGSTSKPYQIDVYGIEREKRIVRYWLCECKYTKTPMNMMQVKKLERAAASFLQEEKDAGRSEPEIRLWLVSTGGFTGEVLEYVKEWPDIYFSDYEGINGIFQAFGGGYEIPIFKHDDDA